VDEKHPIRPVDVNGINKLAGEGYHLSIQPGATAFARACCRLTNTYGPGMRVKDARQTFLGIWVRQLIEGSTIKVFGDGSQVRDFNLRRRLRRRPACWRHRRQGGGQGLQPGQRRGHCAEDLAS
jgi:nucleoside-diphosphate-sugar epimerase